ncbi:hypothetical protein ACFQJ5_01845 [Halomicroarcula sp. GCM10025324]|uniref:hypothetical protein n=1 Tax=Haloarcula TaxID=2237 RepID=UPI0023E8AE92|nr:hypothetical protein [Halomicroarcula sp. ZS-22-S1]
MYSRDHAFLSVVVGVLGSLAFSVPVPWWAAVGYAVVVGVAIDVDHFVVARLTTGEWTAAKRCLRNPRLVFVAQDEIFDAGDLYPLQRLLSHHVIGGALVGGLWLVSEPLALFTALVLYAHVLSDLVWDNSLLEQYHREAAEQVTADDATR